MPRWIKIGALAAGPLAALALVATPLIAHDRGHGGDHRRGHDVRLAPVSDPVVAKECASCHMLYPPGLLPARSWVALMAGLDDHFGDNAALDDATARRVTDDLTANAADKAGNNRVTLRGLAATDAPLRITELPSWQRKHERKDRVAPAALKRAGAKFKGDCKACHKQAEQGWFDDDD
ncbi:diheme cytochrome c [Blastochloris viridis]|uniref:Dihem cytochrome c n=1 Tax=Blastochloris viridis TaxID=1079 RepID=A0A0H5BFE3_BLAVI|nr:diheme cytochrome c [Blastochloris viridis]ALK10237.1 Dihem cytochrome c [Blastochloris viridis]BAR99829.1 Ni,Fe-hydrogenase I cytochrome b subunit [Blastochloris viridis]CUU42901.1 Dihem cytochrome c [Blastochloris viridis]